MKIAIPTAKPSPDAFIESRFGRSQYFLIYDTQKDSFEIIPNQIDLLSPVGAGIQAAQKIVEAGVEVVIVGNCGPKAMQVLKASGIQVITGEEGISVKEAVAKYKRKEEFKVSLRQ